MNGKTDARTNEARIKQAREIYARKVVPNLEVEDNELVVVIDIHSEDYEIGEDLIEICRCLKDRRPQGDLCGFRLGGGAIDRKGPGGTRACLRKRTLLGCNWEVQHECSYTTRNNERHNGSSICDL